MRRITFICHGPTSANRRMAFPADEPLDDGAASGIDALRRVLGRADRVLTSPLLRARQTAAALGLDAQTDTDGALVDLDHGRWSGQALAEVHAAEPDAFRAWREEPGAAPHGGEAISELQTRISAWMARQEGARGHLVAVSHVAVIRAAALHALGAPLTAFWRLDIEPLSLTHMRFDGRRWALRALNQTAFWEGELTTT